MTEILYGLYIEDKNTLGSNPYGYYNTMEEVEGVVKRIKQDFEHITDHNNIFVAAHDYSKKTNSIVNFNYDDRRYLQ